MTLFELLGVSNAAEAEALWPEAFPLLWADPVVFGAGAMQYLQDHLTFRNVRPGASSDGVGLMAELHVTGAEEGGLHTAVRVPQMPDLRMLLRNTLDAPARLYVTQRGDGVELIIEALPVELQLPAGMLEPLEPEGSDVPPRDVTYPDRAERFLPGRYDDFKVVLRYQAPSSIFVHLRIRMTVHGELILEPSVPISIGPCRFLGVFACHGLHDIGFVPSPELAGDADRRQQALEWTRHTLNWAALSESQTGVLTVRTVDIDTTRSPLREVVESMRGGPGSERRLQLVLEDLALPFYSVLGVLPPFPVHGRVGIRRDLDATRDPSALAEYDLGADPIAIDLGDVRIVLKQLMLQTPASETDPFIFFDLAIVGVSREGEEPRTQDTAFTLTLADDWTVLLGFRNPGEERRPVEPTEEGGARRLSIPGWKLFDLAGLNIAISAMGLQAGVSIQRSLGAASGEYGPEQTFVLLFDLGIFGTEPVSDEGDAGAEEGSDSSPIAVRTQSDRPVAIVMRDIGWNLGVISFGGFSLPEGVELVCFDVLSIFITELSFISENNGGYYLVISGGIQLGFGEGTRGESSSEEGEASGDGGGDRLGIWFERLRFRVGGNDTAPAFLLDGVSIDIRVGGVELVGFGVYREEWLEAGSDEEHKISEFGSGLTLRFEVSGVELMLGAQFFRGSIVYPHHAERSFVYWLGSLQYSPIPIGPYQVVNIRVLVAENLAPRLGEAHPDGPSMRLLHWYVENEDALTLPDNRTFVVWERKQGAFSFGAGLGLTFPGGKSIRLDLFVFYHSGPDEQGLLILLRVYMLQARNPVGYGALELDLRNDKWGLLVGVDLNLGDLLGIENENLKLVRLTGTLYAGNKPGTFALGRLGDQSSWLSLLVELDVAIIKLHAQVGLCVELVEGGPNGFGLVVSVRAFANLGIGDLQAYLTLGLMVGAWRNESSACGVKVWIEAGLRIRLFYVFTFGIGAKAEYESLGSSSAYRRLVAEFRLETPFFLPDITWRHEQVWDTPEPEKLVTVSTPVSSASALPAHGQDPVMLVVTPLRREDLVAPPVGDAPPTGPGEPGSHRVIDERALYALERLDALPPPSFHDLPDAEPIGVDGAITLDFKPAVADWLVFGEETPEGAGQEPSESHENELSLQYELVELGIARRPRFGSTGAWDVLLDPADSRLRDPHAPSERERSEAAWPVLTRWDRDVTNAGELDPRRLIINGRTPYTFATGNPEADEDVARNEPGWPCATPAPAAPVWHTLHFRELPPGVRAPWQQQFSGSQSVVHWALERPPLILSKDGEEVARIPLVRHGVAPIATLLFDELAFRLEIDASWIGLEQRLLLIVMYRGLTPIDMVRIELRAPTPIVAEAPGGMTSAVVYDLSLFQPQSAATDGWPSRRLDHRIEIAELRYLTWRSRLEDDLQRRRREARRALERRGEWKFAWLPNHEYEVTVRVKVSVAQRRASTTPLASLVTQKVRFLTRGLPGLNAVERIGAELEGYLEGFAPQDPPRLLYRREPLALGFTPKFDSFLPLESPPSPDAPPEQLQLLEWGLVVHHLGGTRPAQRLSQTSADWLNERIAAVRATDRLLSAGLLRKEWRRVPSLDPRQLRFDAMRGRPDACGEAATAPPRSQVLVHMPVGLPGEAPDLWPVRSTLRAHVRPLGAPFVHRERFAEGDERGFSSRVASGAARRWSVVDGALQPTRGAAGLQYAAFGQSSWNHLQCLVSLRTSPGGMAGVAIAISGDPVERAILAVLVGAGAGEPPRLRLFRATGDGLEALSEALPLESAPESHVLHVIAFDDRVRASVGEVSVEAARGGLREGELALVADGEAAFGSLRVEGLDAYRFEFRTSRYASFEEHLASFSGVPAAVEAEMPGPDSAARTTVAAYLTAELHGRIAEVMTAGASRDARQALWEECVDQLGLMMRERLEALTMTRLVRDHRTELFILESPEPIAFSREVTLELRRVGELVPVALLSSGDETRALIIPLSRAAGTPRALPDGSFELRLRLARERFRGDASETLYRGDATLTFELGEPVALVHRASASTTRANWTVLEHSSAFGNEEAVLLVTPRLEAPRIGTEVMNDHAIGVFYTRKRWAIFNQDRRAMPVGAAFNVSIGRGHVHHASAINTSANFTWLEAEAGNPRAILIVTPNWNPDGRGSTYLDHPIGVGFDGRRWAVFNQDRAPMPRGAAFNVLSVSDGLVHTATRDNTVEHMTWIADPRLRDRPEAILLVTPNWNPGTSRGVYHPHAIGVAFREGRWAIFNQDRHPMKQGASFNVWLAGFEGE